MLCKQPDRATAIAQRSKITAKKKKKSYTGKINVPTLVSIHNVIEFGLR